MVVTAASSTSTTVVWHDSTGTPSKRPVQAPHSPSPQPGFAPVRPRVSRSQPGSGPVVAPGSQERPFTVTVIVAIMKAADPHH